MHMTNAGAPEPGRPAPIPLVGVDEIHDLLLRISRARVRELTYRSDFPKPAAELAEGDVWLQEDVEAWLIEHGDAAALAFLPDRCAATAGRRSDRSRSA